jgi:hypothetical protein
MSQPSQPAPILEPGHVAFMTSGVSINVAARDAHNIPALTRALGCRVSADRRTVTVFVAVPDAARLLDNLRINGAIAAVFSQPSTHHTIQLKGADARVVAREPDDPVLFENFIVALAADLAHYGWMESYVRTMLSHDDENIVAVAFTPNAAFNQTPGPAAGAPLASTGMP